MQTKTAILKAIANFMSKNKARKICANAELSGIETSIILEHYCSPSINADTFCTQHGISIDQLNRRKSLLSNKILNFFENNLNYFSYNEIKLIILFTYKDRELKD